MGGTSKSSQTQTQQLAPYDPAKEGLNGILGGLTGMVGQAGLNSNQSGALDTIVKNANTATGQMSPAITNGTLGLLNGGGATANDGAIKQNLADYKGLLADTASGANIGNNPALKAQLDQIRTDVTDQTNGTWAAAGRDGSPGNMQALGRGIAAGTAPVIAAQYNADADRALGAAGAIYGAGNSTYGLLNGTNATANENFTNGVGTAGKALDASNFGANAASTGGSAEVRHSGVAICNAARCYRAGRGAVRHQYRTFGRRTANERRAAIRDDRARARLALAQGQYFFRSVLKWREFSTF